MKMPIEMYKNFWGGRERRFVAFSRVHSCFAPSSALGSRSPARRSDEDLLVTDHCFAAVAIFRSTLDGHILVLINKAIGGLIEEVE
jgi:hypothetical protein